MKREKKNWFAENIFNIIFLIIIILLLGSGYWAYSEGYFPLKQSVLATEEQEEFLNKNPDTECRLTISPSSINYGDEVTGLIWTRTPNTFCEVFGKMEGDDTWIKVSEGTTDIDGNLANTEEFFLEGDFTFAGICRDCRTNDDELHVNPEIIMDCTDSDGINKMTPGWVIEDGIYYYDSCVDDVVTEYYCDGDGVQTRILPCDIGYECVFTRSGAFCDSIPTWSDGDVVGSNSGNSVTSAPFNSFEIDLSNDFVPGGNCGLMATITAGWTYGNQNCQGLQGSEGVSWIFYDSDSPEWSRVDTQPTYLGSATECILDYDGTPFRLTMEKILGLPECEIDYEWEINVIACGC